MTIRHPGALSPILALMRPGQWVKNAFVFAALVFAGKLTDPRLVLLSLQAFAAFCLLSSGVYIINDIADAEEDRRHPRKKDRPVASGAVSPGRARLLALLCLLDGAGLCYVTGPNGRQLLLVGVAYVLLEALGRPRTGVRVPPVLEREVVTWLTAG